MFVNVLRPEGDRPFSERDRDILHCAMAQVRSWLGIRLMPFGISQPRGLSPRARQIMALLLRGHAEKEIAAELGLSPHTVHHHVKNLHRSLGVCDRNGLRFSIQNLLALPPPAATLMAKGRQAEVLSQLLQGLSERQIAFETGLSSHTIHDHIKDIYRSFAVHSRAELSFKLRMWTGRDMSGHRAAVRQPGTGNSPFAPRSRECRT